MPTRDMRAAGPFRNGVERAIASLARARAVRDAGVRVLADDITKKDPCLGAEWWIQDVAPDEPPKKKDKKPPPRRKPEESSDEEEMSSDEDL